MSDITYTHFRVEKAEDGMFKFWYNHKDIVAIERLRPGKNYIYSPKDITYF